MQNFEREHMEAIERANERNQLKIAVAQKLLRNIKTEKEFQLLKYLKNRRPYLKIDMLSTTRLQEPRPEEK